MPEGDEDVAIGVHIDRVAVVHVGRIRVCACARRNDRLLDRVGVIARPPVPHEVALRINLLHGAIVDCGVGTVVVQTGEIDPRKLRGGQEHEVAVGQQT